jgi:hypothetical protein
MHKQLRNSREIVVGPEPRYNFRRWKTTKLADLVSMNPVSDLPNAVDRVQSACKMQYDGGAR